MSTLIEIYQSGARVESRTALWTSEGELTYGALSRRAAELANALGVSTEAEAPRTALLVGKTHWGFASILGALAAGTTYVPLNPAFPVGRLARMIEKSEATVLVVDREGLALLPALLELALPPLDVIGLGLEATEFTSLVRGPHRARLTNVDADAAPAGLPSRCRPTDLAYILFTSGSTGEPKAVGVSHHSASRYIRSILELYQPTPEDRFSQFFDFTFDLSVHDLFMAWGAGGSLFAADRTARLAPARFVNAHKLTFWFSVPSLVSQLELFCARTKTTLPSVRYGLFCGEALPVKTACSFLGLAPQSRVENLYGPTEATIAFTRYAFDPATADEFGPVVPIGQPLPGQAVAVVDSDGHPVQAGEIGELWLGGDQVVAGYYRDPERTRQRFPTAMIGGVERTWYRTGDLVSEHPKAGLIFHGRADRQVKVRGYRVELQEVEMALSRMAPQSQVAVIAVAEGDTSFLVAFLTGRVDADDLRSRCVTLLPDYMRPSHLLPLGELPLNSNGKVDYGQLKRLFLERPTQSSTRS